MSCCFSIAVLSRSFRSCSFCLAFLRNDSLYCNYIDLDWYRFYCFAVVSGNLNECMRLDGDERDFCMAEFASVTGNDDFCTDIANTDIRILCEALANRNPVLCSSINDSSLRERCRLHASYQ